MSKTFTAKAQYLRSLGRVHIVKLNFSSAEAKKFYEAQQNPEYLNYDDKGNITTVIARSIMPFMSTTRPINFTFGFNKKEEFFAGPEDTTGAIDDSMQDLVNAEKAKLIAQAQLGLIQLPGARKSAPAESTSRPKETIKDIPGAGNEAMDALAQTMQENGANGTGEPENEN